MANQKYLDILDQGIDAWNYWIDSNVDERPDLSNVDFSHRNLEGVIFNHANLYAANLQEANFRGARLIHANLNRANLSKADFPYAVMHGANLSEATLHRTLFENAILNTADLTKADLSHANLRECNLSNSDLTNSNLSDAELSETNFTNAILKNTKFSNAHVSRTIFCNNNLSKTIDIDTVSHIGFSYLGIDTIFRSEGKIPLVFLWGCGLSDLQIEIVKLAMPDLNSEQITDISYKFHQLYLGGGIQYYSCFISHSNKDQEFAQQLYDDLQNNGVRCWFDREDLKIGDPIRPTIDRQIRLRDKLLVILSESSVKSEWVGDEVEGAIEEEGKSNRLVLFPIRLDDTVLNTRDDWAAKIKRRRHIGDFSNWKDKSSYQKAFERLLRDLKATGGQ